jgi:hypothetical protein
VLPPPFAALAARLAAVMNVNNVSHLLTPNPETERSPALRQPRIPNSEPRIPSPWRLAALPGGLGLGS